MDAAKDAVKTARMSSHFRWRVSLVGSCWQQDNPTLIQLFFQTQLDGIGMERGVQRCVVRWEVSGLEGVLCPGRRFVDYQESVTIEALNGSRDESSSVKVDAQCRRVRCYRVNEEVRIHTFI